MTLVFALVVATLGVDATIQRYKAPSWAGVGLAVDHTEGRIRISRVEGPEAQKAGIREGDTITSVNGVPTSDDDDELQALRTALRKANGDTILLGTRRGAGPAGEHRLTWRNSNVMLVSRMWANPNAALAVELAAGLAPALVLILGAMILRRSSGSDGLAALLSLSLLLVASSNFVSDPFWVDNGDSFEGKLLGNLGWFGILFVLMAPPDGRFSPRWTVLLPIIVLIVQTFDLFRGLADSTKTFVHVVAFGAGTWLVWRRYRNVGGIAARRVRWVVIGFAAGTFAIALGLGWQMAGPRAAIGTWLPSNLPYLLYAAGVCFYVGGLLVAVQRYGLYDGDAFITRTTAYAGLILLGGIVYALYEAVAEPYMEAALSGASPWLIKALPALVAVAAAAPLRKALEDWADRRFRKRLTELRDRLPRDLGELGESLSAGELLDEIVSRVAKGAGATGAAILLDSDQRLTTGLAAEKVEEWRRAQLAGDVEAVKRFEPTDELFPLRVPLRARPDAKVPPVGWLLIGARPNLTLYGADEREALLDLSGPVTRAVRRSRAAERERALLESIASNFARMMAAPQGASSSEAGREAGFDSGHR